MKKNMIIDLADLMNHCEDLIVLVDALKECFDKRKKEVWYLSKKCHDDLLYITGQINFKASDDQEAGKISAEQFELVNDCCVSTIMMLEALSDNGMSEKAQDVLDKLEVQQFKDASELLAFYMKPWLPKIEERWPALYKAAKRFWQ